jgi:2,4-dienoyl-CoA reductase-like NADH-dependent reductase (Old Yellow Enzyme family)
MSSIFTLDNIEDFSEKINIDELYEKKRQQDLNKLALFNKILNRVHVRIRTTSRQKTDEQFCWFLVPETILGVPKYDQASCIAYLMDKLKTSGFNVRYVHPNLLFISWLHWIPQYVRTEIKKKTGIITRTSGMITSLKQAECIVKNKKADLIAVGREFIKNPTWLIKEMKKLKKDVIQHQYKRCFE